MKRGFSEPKTMIYLDANATAPLRPAARSALDDLVRRGTELGNSSSVHAAGRTARGVLTDARNALESLTGGRVVFTSGGTEACNALVWGFADVLGEMHAVSSSIEHPAMLEALRRACRHNGSLVMVDPEPDGVVSVDAFLAAVTDDISLVSLMVANNETGALQPVAECARALRRAGFSGAILSDCTQLLGKSTRSIADLFAVGVDAVSISGHKCGAPCGVGAIVLNRGGVCREFAPLILGGPQEERLRAGTENLFAIAAFGEVVREVDFYSEAQRMYGLREELWEGLRSRAGDVQRLTPLDALTNTLLVRVPGCRGDDLCCAFDLRGLCVSTGAACASGKQGVSHVVRAMGLSEHAAREVVRFSLSWATTAEEISAALEIVSDGISCMRRVNRAGAR